MQSIFTHYCKFNSSLPDGVNTLIALADGNPVGICVSQLFPVQQSSSHSNKVRDEAFM